MPSELTASIPDSCNITFVQVLSRHGSRDPTLSKTLTYAWLVDKIKTNVASFPGKYSFLKDFTFTLGAGQLTRFGQNEMYDSGVKFYHRYKTLTRSFVPFIRAAGQDRVVGSAGNFSKGFHSAKTAEGIIGSYPYSILEISEDADSNNTLHHGLCDRFEDGPESDLASRAQALWLATFGPQVTARLNRDLLGANLTLMETILMMDLCPFETVASMSGKLSSFCHLFSENEWHQYDYFQSLGKYYGYSNGNLLGPTQGVGFVNELIARMTSSPIKDHTSVNHTLDSWNETFPLGPSVALYADFSHDKYVPSYFAVLFS